jgi:hypothetical protein
MFLKCALIMAAVICSLPAMAQNDVEQRSLKEASVLKAQLQLDTVVCGKILDTIRLYNQRIHDRIAVNETAELKKAAIKELNRNKTIGIRSQLTQQQKDKYKSDRDAMLARMRQARPGHTYPDDIDNDN